MPQMDDLTALASHLGITKAQVVTRPSHRAKNPTPVQAHRIKLLKRIYKLRMEGIQLVQTLLHLAMFFACSAKWRIIDGGNRSSKTFSCLVEAARAFMGCDPYDKYPPNDGNALVVGKDADEVSRIWRVLAQPGAFKKIKDEKTNLWRAVRADPENPLVLDPYDLAYQETWCDAPPLLAPRMIRDVAWESRGKGQPRLVTLTNGWRVLLRPSHSEPPTGDHYNFVHLDEQLQNARFFDESNRGLVGIDEQPKHMPKGIWSATSHSTNMQLYELREASDQGAEYVKAFKTTISQNPYFPEKEKAIFYESLSEEERRIRFYGEYALASRFIYSAYQPMGVHGCDSFEIPPDYCRVVVLDPGRNHCGTLFLAIPPSNAHAYVYDGFDLRHADAGRWAEEVEARQGDMKFYAGVIDQQMGKQHPPGEGQTVAAQYFAALREADVEFQCAGPLDGFFPGSNHIEARENSVLGWMRLRGTGALSGTPKLQVFRGAIPKLDTQIKSAHHNEKDKRVYGKGFAADLVTCLEYGAAFDPQHTAPEPVVFPSAQEKRSAADLLREKQIRQRRHRCGRPRHFPHPTRRRSFR